MNLLKVLTKPQPDDTFIVYWTNTQLSMRGAVRVSVPIQKEDRKIIAELYALQYLLEVKEAVGNNSAGHEDTKLIVSFGAIRKLARKDSAKQTLAEYAMFLTTRFKGCPIEVEQSEKWIEPEVEPSITLDASALMDEKIVINGVGEVVLTSHVVEQYMVRFVIPNFKRVMAERAVKAAAGQEVGTDAAKTPTLGDAWRKLRRIAAEPKVREYEKNNSNTRLKYALKGREEGRYYEHTTQELIFVVGKNGKSQPALVTVYPLNQPE